MRWCACVRECAVVQNAVCWFLCERVRVRVRVRVRARAQHIWPELRFISKSEALTDTRHIMQRAPFLAVYLTPHTTNRKTWAAIGRLLTSTQHTACYLTHTVHVSAQ